MNVTKGMNAMLVLCDHKLELFSYLTDLSDLGTGFGQRPLWDALLDAGATCADQAALLRSTVEAVAAAQTPQARFVQIILRSKTGGCRAYQVGVVCTGAEAPITITLQDVAASSCCEDMDERTGLITSRSFFTRVEKTLLADPTGVQNGDYAVVYLDMLRFKAVNEMLGRARGDEVLRFVGSYLRGQLTEPECICCVEKDHFGLFLRTAQDRPETLLHGLHAALQHQGLPTEVLFNAGVYVTTGTELSASEMLDRATMAQAGIKGRYDLLSIRYTEAMRSELLSVQEIEGLMAIALEEQQFVVYYQPQYNHANGMLIGAEALVRWQHPERGMIPPGDFIPLFEKNGFITQLDLYVFEQVCAFLRRCLDQRWAMVPVSTNFSRYDIFQPDFVDQLEAIRNRYDVPTRFLRVEMTESAMVEGTQYINEVIGRLHQAGYVVEMDDFGAGYSSLTALKDIDLDVIKLDMQFLSGASGSRKGGTILSSIIRMAKWLAMPVIAEGVETVEQADYLRSIGCDYIQGYLYARPLPEDAYMQLVSSGRIGATVPQMELIDTFNAVDFWDPNSQETLIFSNYVGAAAIFGYQDGQVEILRVNKKYLQELSMNLTERDLIESNPWETMDEENRHIYQVMLAKAVETMEEQECETWRTITSACCGEERFCIRATVRIIGRSGNRFLFHAMIRNVTAEKLYYDSILDSERRFKFASEQANIYFWEYNILSHEMRPCFRCMRDLDLPPLVTNYPEPLIEAGIFPAEIADDYRAYMRQIDQGAAMPPMVVPLTANRVPFHVRYTTEFDDNGHPVKAYGSATLVVDGQ